MYMYMIWLLYILESKINHNFDIKKTFSSFVMNIDAFNKISGQQNSF